MRLQRPIRYLTIQHETATFCTTYLLIAEVGSEVNSANHVTANNGPHFGHLTRLDVHAHDGSGATGTSSFHFIFHHWLLLALSILKYYINLLHCG